MTVSKLRAAFVVFLIGFALGVSMFAASRLFVRSVLSADATAAAAELASRLAAGEPIEGSGTLVGRALQLFRPERATGEERRYGRPPGADSAHARRGGPPHLAARL